MPDVNRIARSVPPTPAASSAPPATPAATPSGKADENTQLLALRIQIINAYSAALPLTGKSKETAVSDFSKLLDAKKIKLAMNAKQQGDTGYQFKLKLNLLLKQLGGAETDAGKKLINELRNSLNFNFMIDALDPNKATKPTAPAPVAPASQPVESKPEITQATARSTSSLGVLLGSVLTAEEKAAFLNTSGGLSGLTKAEITKDNVVLVAALTSSAMTGNPEFRKALSADGVKIFDSIDEKKNSLSEILTALDGAISASPQAADALKDYKAAIKKVLDADIALPVTNSAATPEQPNAKPEPAPVTTTA